MFKIRFHSRTPAEFICRQFVHFRNHSFYYIILKEKSTNHVYVKI